jgi:hypothetical protein
MKKQLKLLIGLCLLSGSLRAQEDALARSFIAPPDSAKPHTWWHWMNGNITREGITADLEAMKHVGISGAQIFNVDEDIPEGPAPFLSPQWLELFRFAALEAKRLGIELAFHNGAGWSSSGGPWVKPEHAMQTVVTSELHVKGPVRFDAVVPQPKAILGHYRDIALLAFPTPGKEASIPSLSRKTLSGGSAYSQQPSAAAVVPEAVVQRGQIIDLTSKLAQDGTLVWEAPAGDWTLLRIGHTPTGATNRPAPEAGRGAPAKVAFEKLISWPEHTEAGVRYFSGTATYSRTLDIPAECISKGRELHLDLGRVQVIAEVRLNGRNLGTMWKAPYLVDLTTAARAGKNDLEIEVTNLWPNRLIGDEQLPEDIEWAGLPLKRWPEWLLKGAPRPVTERVTFTTWHHWRKDSQLLPSGLLGPVMLRPLVVVPISASGNILKEKN